MIKMIPLINTGHTLNKVNLIYLKYQTTNQEEFQKAFLITQLLLVAKKVIRLLDLDLCKKMTLAEVKIQVRKVMNKSF
jgi:7-cyano-7-deazaguanine synthase in queuosine biosynthesis